MLVEIVVLSLRSMADLLFLKINDGSVTKMLLLSSFFVFYFKAVQLISPVLLDDAGVLAVFDAV